MFGLGFLFTAALTGVGLVGWPVYLHFRKRKRNIQVVPSLRLFGFVRKRTKRLRLQQLLLLIARSVILIALFMLLAQPFIRTKLQLPFPRVAGDTQEERVLAIVIDDSLASLHENTKGTRLKQSKDAIRSCIRKLPDLTKVVFVPTSCPFPTKPLEPAQALEFIEQIEPVPMRGNAVDALRNLNESLSGRPCCIVMAVPREDRMWNKLKINVFSEKTPVIFFDTSRIESEALITGYSDDTIHIAGRPEGMQLLKIRIEGQQGDVEVRSITTHDALRGELNAPLSAGSNKYYKISFDQPTANPWNTYYAQAGSRSSTRPTIAIVRASTPEAVTVDQMITAIILSFNDDVSLHHIDPAKPGALPEADVLVIAGNPRISQALRPWITQRISSGSRIVCIPTPGMTGTGQQLPMLPNWRSPVEVRPAELPLLTATRSSLPLDDLALLGVARLPVTETFQPDLGKSQEVILSTKTGRSVLVCRDLGRGGNVWALGFPPKPAPDSPAWHPAFPILMQQIMMPAGQALAGKEAIVGHTLQLHDWFGRDEIAGELVAPSGLKRRVASSIAAPLTIALDAAGAYSLPTDSGETLWRVANYPREMGGVTFPREQLEAVDELLITWADDGIRVGSADFQKLGQPISPENFQVLDLSVLALILLAAAMLLEGVMLSIVWHREGFVRA